LELPIRALFVSVDGPVNPHSFGQLALLEEADDEAIAKSTLESSA